MIKSPEQMFEASMKLFFEQLKEANIDITKAVSFIHGDGAVCIGRFNEETQDDEEFLRNIVDMFADCSSEEGLYYAQKRIAEEIAELEKE